MDRLAVNRWQKIKHHKVVEWTLAYIAFAYALLHVAEMLTEAQEWPHIIVRLLSFALIFAVPVVVTVAWYHGHKARHRISTPELVIITLLLFVAGSVVWWLARPHGETLAVAPTATPSTSGAAPERSIAVLPFVDLSEKHDQEYFADGMAEEILDTLVKVPSLKVIGRTSSFQFKGKADDLRMVGQKLGAAYLLEGSVRRSADRFRITAQLVSAADGAHRWSQTYDRDERDAIVVEDEIATSIVRALQIEVTSFPSRIRPKNDEAYEHYLRGLHAQNRFDEEGFNTAVAEFQHALDADPAFAPAAEQLAMTKYFLAQWGFVSAAKGYAETRFAADAAIALDPRSAEAYNARALAELESTCDWQAADRDLTTALKILPNDAGILVSLAQQRIVIGQYSEALRFLDAAVASDPLEASAYMIRQWVYLRSGRVAEAEAASRRALEIAPTDDWGHYRLAMPMVIEGRYEAALAELQKESLATARDLGLVVVYQAVHRTKDAEVAFERFMTERGGADLTEVAAAYTAFGKYDQAFEWLERARQDQDPDLCYVRRDPLFKALEADPRYKEFLRKLGLPQ